MKVEVPFVVAGRFEKKGDRDWYRFAVEKGERLALEGEARTLGSPCDVFLRLYGSDGGWLADLDPTRGAGTRLEHRFPEEGEVFLLVEELNGGGAPEQGYRVNIGPAGPGFSLEVEEDVFEARSGAAHSNVTRPPSRARLRRRRNFLADTPEKGAQCRATRGKIAPLSSPRLHPCQRCPIPHSPTRMMSS
jgi:hypothetical protein